MSTDKKTPTIRPTDEKPIPIQLNTVVGASDLDVKRIIEYNPISYLGTWDFIVVFTAVLLRLIVETNVKAQKIEREKGETFDAIKYFDMVHITRWMMHLIGAFLGVIVLPEIFVLFIYQKYDIGLTDWNLIMSMLVGLFGYDLIKMIEKLVRLLLSKFITSNSKTDD